MGDTIKAMTEAVRGRVVTTSDADYEDARVVYNAPAQPQALRQPVFDFRAHFCHSAPFKTHAFDLMFRANIGVEPSLGQTSGKPADRHGTSARWLRSHGRFNGWFRAFTIRRSDDWIFAGTGLKRGVKFGSADTIVGCEGDGCQIEWREGAPYATGKDSTPANLMRFSPPLPHNGR